MSILHVKGVSKSFAGLKALNDVNLVIDEGGVHAIIGPNGAGKSTLLNCFVGRLKPDSGAVTFGGRLEHPRDTRLIDLMRLQADQ